MMCGHSQLLHPPSSRSGRRRSADIGGLSLATRSGAHGRGWLGHSDDELQTRFAELLSDMYTETLNAVNEGAGDCNSFLPELTPETRSHLIAALDGWNFEPRILPNEDYVVACAVLMFEALFRIEGMEEAVGVPLAQIAPFIQHLRHIYRWQNSYHNFEHALDVLQATYTYLRAARVVPPMSILLKPGETWVPPPPSTLTANDNSDPSRAQDRRLMSILTRTDLFILLVAAIGHDVGHPGFTNAFMANAAAPLSAVFDGKSPLEQMHCALLLRVMRAHGMDVLLDGANSTAPAISSSAPASGRAKEAISSGQGKRNRRLLCETVLATDMRVHDTFMQRFADLLARRGDLGSTHRRTTLCQAIIKCADISNPSRPYYISQHWASALLREWNAQALLEAHHALPPTVEASGDPLREASSQVFFVPRFVKPLLDLVVRAVPEMQPYASQCDLNLALWSARLAILQGTNEGTVSTTYPTKTSRRVGASLKDKLKARPTVPPRQPEDYNGAFPLALPPAHLRTPPASVSGRDIVDTNFSWSAASAPRPPSTTMSMSEDDLDSEASFTFSPSSRGTSTTSASPAPMSAASSDSSGSEATAIPLDDGTAAIRAAASRACSCSKLSKHRNSWSPALGELDGWKLSAGVS